MSEGALAGKLAVLRPHPDERQWRLLLGTEAVAIGRGGIALVARLSGASRTLDRTLAMLRESGYPVLDEDVLRINPYGYAHINVHGHYSFQPLQLADGIGRRPLRDPGNADPDEE